MTNRENILRTLRRQQPERFGFDLGLSPALLEEFKRRTGRGDYQEYDNFPVRILEIIPKRVKTDFSRFFTSLPPDTRPPDSHPERGVTGAPEATAHFQEMLHPMPGVTGWQQVRDCPWPDVLADFRWEAPPQRAQEIKDRDLVCAIAWNRSGTRT